MTSKIKNKKILSVKCKNYSYEYKESNIQRFRMVLKRNK